MPKPNNFESNKGVIKLAARAGCSINTASRKLRQGKTPAEVVAEAAAWKEKQSRTKPKASSKAQESFFEAQARKERALASLRELELTVKCGELVPLAEVNAWVASMLIRARDILLRIGPELADRLSKEADPVTVKALIDGEVRRALNELATVKV